MEGVHVVAVAPPGNALAARLDLEAYQVGDGAGGTVLAGDPFGIQERHGAGLGGHGHSHMEEAPCGVGGIHLQLDRGLRVQRQSQQREESNGGNTHSFDSSNASCARASAVKCHTDLLSEFEFRRLPFYLTFASVVAVLCSNSASNCLIGAAVVALVVCHFRFGDALRFPPVELPLGLFFLATLISLALSGHIGEGWPGPRKFYLCVVLLLVASTFRKLSEVPALVVACTGAMTLSALWSLGQFWRKVQEAQALHEDFRTYYTVKRITGFTSHWMTLSGQEMMVLMLVCALAVRGRRGHRHGVRGCVHEVHVDGRRPRRRVPGVAAQSPMANSGAASRGAAAVVEPDGCGRPYGVGIQAGGRSGFQPVPRGLPPRRLGNDQSAPVVWTRSGAGEGAVPAIHSRRYPAPLAHRRVHALAQRLPAT